MAGTGMSQGSGMLPRLSVLPGSVPPMSNRNGVERSVDADRIRSSKHLCHLLSSR
jgi:hypothetical protein